MSEDSAPDSADDPVANPPTANDSALASAPESFAGENEPKRGAMRQIILLCLLGLMILALAYDYRVARPNVEKAYDQIAKMNNEMNAQANAIPTLSTHIHKEIGRDPARTFTEGVYRIEVFSWTAGLPFRTHDLYAVYAPNGNDLVFMRHYKYKLPVDELDPPRSNRGNGADPTDAADVDETNMGGPGEGRGGPPGGGEGDGGGPGRDGEGGGRPQRPSGVDEGDGPGTDEGDGPGTEAAPSASEPAAGTPATSPAPTEDQPPAEADTPPETNEEKQDA